MRILLTNDDGIGEPGIASLESAFRDHELIVVAPSTHMSGCSQSLTLRSWITLEKLDESRYSVSGTPVDCVKLALLVAYAESGPPDLVLSGINPGANLANNVEYSGTVAGAAESASWGIPAIAVSLSMRSSRLEGHLDKAAALFRELFDAGLLSRIPGGSFLNVNIPDLSRGRPRAAVWTRLGSFAGDLPFDTEGDEGPRGPEEAAPRVRRLRYRTEAARREHPGDCWRGTDLGAYYSGLISVSLLDRDRTHRIPRKAVRE
ncbi:5'/3'-nucleotidase SurE [Candidatus Fermentibacterales bacterium]|nr:5'/3'-nucleotidase SurE [Candidatus Fermentibacterales bacterium]